jgi:hypothetical protein
MPKFLRHVAAAQNIIPTMGTAKIRATTIALVPSKLAFLPLR